MMAQEDQVKPQAQGAPYNQIAPPPGKNLMGQQAVAQNPLGDGRPGMASIAGQAGVSQPGGIMGQPLTPEQQEAMRKKRVAATV